MNIINEITEVQILDSISIVDELYEIFLMFLNETHKA